MSEKMKAVRIFEFGGPEVLKYTEYPQPECGDTEVKVRVLASSLSGFDLKYRKGVLCCAQEVGCFLWRAKR